MGKQPQISVATGCAATAAKDGRFVALSIGTRDEPVTVALPTKLVGDLVGKLIAASGGLIDTGADDAAGEPRPKPHFAREADLALSREGALITLRAGTVTLTYALDDKTLRRVEQVLAGTGPAAESS